MKPTEAGLPRTLVKFSNGGGMLLPTVIHSKAEAQRVIDMINASMEFLPDQDDLEKQDESDETR